MSLLEVNDITVEPVLVMGLSVTVLGALGALVSIVKDFCAAIDPAAPAAGKVSMALLPAASLMLPDPALNGLLAI